MENIILNDGYSLPLIGFGTYKTEDTLMSVQAAIESGYRLIDTASIYGNEKEVGEAVKRTTVPRQHLYITSKVWRTDLGYDATRKAFKNTLKRLSLEYLDLYLIHWPANSKNYKDWVKVNAETWRAIEELQDEGLIRSIGVSNFWPEHLEELLNTAKVLPAVNQIEYHPGYQQTTVVNYCKRHNIALQAWSPLARGRFQDHPLLNEIAGKHGKTVSQIILRWTVQQGLLPLPKSSRPQRIKENIDIFDFELSRDEMSAVTNMQPQGFSGERPDIWPDRIN